VTIRAASDRSLYLILGDTISFEMHQTVARATRALEGVRGILNLHPGYASILVDFDPRLLDHAEAAALVRESLALYRDDVPPPSREVEIPMVYGREFGPDLADVARHTGLSPERVIELHAAAEYFVYFVGFSTCFPYLGGLPPELATPRLPAPRKHVPVGSVAIGGSQAGIYPLASPGGWRLIGRTSVKLFDPEAVPPPLLRMGDRVRFVPVAEGLGRPPGLPFSDESCATKGQTRRSTLPCVHVIAPGFLTTVQDLGRFGWAHFGISASGAADPLAFRAANLLVGNPDYAPALEMTLAGGEFLFESPTVIAVTGSDFSSPVPLWTPVEIAAGRTIRFGPTRSGARCYLAVRGGFDVPRVMGSASVHVMTGVGGRPLRKGDRLPIGDAAVRRPRRPARNAPVYGGSAALRATPGPQAQFFGDELYTASFTVSEESNRMGIRLHGTALAAPGGGMISEGVALGAIQVPPDGQPIILFVEHQTSGGYPKPANVIAADFWQLGQLRPRDPVRLERITMEGAVGLMREQERWLLDL
jgi:KipI family sensor histidine kinase inhibitor